MRTHLAAVASSLLTAVLLASSLVVLTSCTHRYGKKPQPVPISPEDRARLDEIRAQLAGPVREIAAIIAKNPDIQPLDRVGGVSVCFTGTPDDLTIQAAASSDITFPDEIVIGDGNGCVSDPPGISCECPCPD